MHYELVLSRMDFDHLCAGCPEMPAVVGESLGGCRFYLFSSPHDRISESFKRMPDGGGYFAYVGAPVPILPHKATREEFDRLAQEAYDNLERAINGSGRIAIEELPPGTLNIGYITMKVENRHMKS